MLELISHSLVARLTFLLVVFVVVVASAMAATQFITQRVNARSAIGAISGEGRISKGTSLRERKDTAWSHLAERIEKAGLSLSDTNSDSLRDKLRAAGYRSPSAPKLFTLIRLIMVFVFPAIYLFSRLGSEATSSTMQTYFICGLFAAIGLYVPNLYVSARASRRREEIDPDGGDRRACAQSASGDCAAGFESARRGQPGKSDERGFGEYLPALLTGPFDRLADLAMAG